MSYLATHVANSVLEFSFRDNSPLNLAKLQRITFLIETHYQKNTGRELISEPYCTWEHGPALHSLVNQFSDNLQGQINRYCQTASGKVFVLDRSQDVELNVALLRVWEKTRNLSALEVCEATKIKGSAWDKAVQAENPVLDPDDIAEDMSFENL